jgi:signal transduction histidine kinase
VVTGVIGWVIAGRLLRPVRLITQRAQSASELDLASRVALDGPDDEMKHLADTFDQMLGRLERSFVAQRSFSAQVSHELRTPLAVILSEVDLLRPSVYGAQRDAVDQIRTAALRAERLIGALLVLSRTESGHLDHDVVRLDELVGDVVGQMVVGPPWTALRVDVELHPASIVGDRALLESLVTNLVDNAGRHNGGAGWVRVRVLSDTERVVLEVANSVSPVPPNASGADAGKTAGNRVGLTVVTAIVAAHSGDVEQGSAAPSEYVVRVALRRVPYDLDAGEPADPGSTLTDIAGG